MKQNLPTVFHSQLATVIFFALCAGTPGSARAFDDTPFARLLAEHVNDDGMVDYGGLKTKRAELEQVVQSFGAVTRKEYDGWTDADKIAFLTNAYNAYTLALIVRKYPVDSIKRLSKPWDRRKWRLLGKMVSLNEIEHGYLRKEFDEPRIHFALVCAAIGCPPLSNKPWRGATLEEQFSVPIKAFLADPAKFRIDRGGKRVLISPLLKWYGGDFVGKYLPTSGFGQKNRAVRSVLGFFATYLDPIDAEFLKKGDYAIRFIDYDWSLNKQ